MRIISPFHDYYDSAMSFGQDETIVYERRTGIVDGRKVRNITWPWESSSHRQGLNLFIQRKKNPMWLREMRLRAGFLLIGHLRQIVWVCPNYELNFDNPRSFLGTTDPNKWVDVAYDRRWFYGTPAREELFLGTPLHYDGMLDEYRHFMTRDDLDSVLIDVEAPVALVLPTETFSMGSHTSAVKKFAATTIVTNPALQALDCARTIHPFDAYQAIAQCVEGVLPRLGNPTVEIDDRSMVEKKGFDPKYGFRQVPGQKRRRKKKDAAQDE